MKRSAEPSTSNLPPIKFLRRQGADDVGRDYEYKITALLALRCAKMKDTKDMWIASNVDKVGDFDDVVLYRKNSSDQCFAYLFQLKHQENPKKITPHEFTYSAKSTEGKRKKWKVDFSLPKYNDGFLELKRNLEDGQNDHFEVLKQIKAAHKLVLIIYTNKDVSSECKFLNEVNDQTLDFINTGTNKQKLYKFDSAKLNYDSEFLNKLLLFANQSHVNDCQKLIKKEIKNLTSSCSATIDFKKVTKKFVEFIKKWIKGDGVDESKDNVRIYTSLTKADILAKLTFIILEPFVFVLFEDPFTQYHCPTKQKWNTILSCKSITVVNFDEETLTFLKEYLGSELSKYSNHPSKTWNEELSKQSQNVFLQHHQDLKLKLLKLICDCKSLTMLDIYISLWFDKQLPLLLKIEDNNTMKTIEKMHKLCNLTFLVLSTETVTFPTIPNIFTTLNDLNEEERAEILHQNVCVQGRPSIPLENITNSSMYQHLKTADIIKIFLGAYNIGYNYEPLIADFVPRGLSKILFNLTVSNHIPDDTFYINNLTKSYYESKILKQFEYVIIEPNMDNLVFSKDDICNSKHNIHELQFINNYFEWKSTDGTIQNLQSLQFLDSEKIKERIWTTDMPLPEDIDNFWIKCEDILSPDYLLQTRIICADPGMGKSILLDFIANKAPPQFWILKINLTDHYKYFEQIKRENLEDSQLFLNYFHDALSKKYNRTSSISNELYRQCVEENKIFLLLDGFDEISIAYKDEVTRIAKCLRQDGIHFWITTRSIMKLHLEEELQLFSNTIRPFHDRNQKDFLIKYFGTLNSHSGKDQLIEAFTEELLLTAKSNLLNTFTNVPLQTKLLANFFKKDLLTSLETNAIIFNARFDLVSLYQSFLDQKNDILCDKLGMGIKFMPLFLEKHQQLFALKTVFRRNDLSELDIEGDLKEYYEDDLRKVQFLQTEGIVVVKQNATNAEEKFDVNFVHRTFAEFVAARWLLQNIHKEQFRDGVKHLSRQRFNEQSQFMYTIFDLMICKNCPLHLAIINKQIEVAVGILKSTSSAVEELDLIGRSAVHLIALHGRYHTMQMIHNKISVQDEILEILKIIPTENLISYDHIFQFSSLDFAIQMKTFHVANLLLQKLPNLQIKTYIHEKEYLFQYCLQFGYEALLKAFLMYFGRRELLIKKVDQNISIKDYLFSGLQFCDVRVPLEEYENKSLKELFDLSEDLHLTCAFGDETQVTNSVTAAKELNVEDAYFCTPLHYAVIHNRVNIIKFLLSKGADVKSRGNTANTALHFAAEHADKEMIELLIEKGCDVDEENNEGNTPLCLAVFAWRIEIAKLLIDKGSSINLKNDMGQNILHICADFLYSDVMFKIFLTNTQLARSIINAKDNDEQTALYLAVRPGEINFTEELLDRQIQIIECLLQNGADVNAQCFLGETVLHTCVRDFIDVAIYRIEHNLAEETDASVDKLNEYQKEVLRKLLEAGADVNIKNDRRKTALDLALRDGKNDLIQLLQSYQQIV